MLSILKQKAEHKLCEPSAHVVVAKIRIALVKNHCKLETKDKQ